MNVCIVTFYSVINTGSFWQAEALRYTLTKLGHDVYYYPIKTANDASDHFKNVINLSKHILRRRLSEAKMLPFQVYRFRQAQKLFNVIDATSEIDKIDCFILGSDIIWAIDHPTQRKLLNVLWGGDFIDKKVISYAASVGSCPKELLLDNERIRESLQNLEAIGVRDQYTFEIVNNVIGRQPEIVCDPSMLINLNEYRNMVDVEREKETPFIFFYMFKSLTPHHFAVILSFAKENGFKIKYGVIRDRNDKERFGKVVCNEPFEFLLNITKASYVITDTFHGTCFSMNLKKKFIIYNNNWKQVRTYISLYGYLDRLVNESDDIIVKLTEKKDFIKRYDNIIEHRSQSMKFLRENLS